MWIGLNAIIKDGVEVGDGAIIGCNAVVTKNVPPYAIMGGVPAKIISYRFRAEIIKELLELKWWYLPQEFVITLPFDDVEACIKKIKQLKTIK